MGQVSGSKYLVTAGWDDVPHLTEATKRDLLTATPPFLRDARSKGTPSLGAGAIYPVEESRIKCDPFPIPPFWRRGYGMDVGWNRTAVMWLAEDPADKVLYGYAEHYMGQALPSIHTSSIKLRGDWIKGAIDPASRGRSQSDGEQLLGSYRALGLHLKEADNGVESGLYEVWSRLEFGRLRIFSTLQNWFSEYRLYRRDTKGHVVKTNDHIMDACRYGVVEFDRIASVQLSVRDRAQGTGHAPERTAGY